MGRTATVAPVMTLCVVVALAGGLARAQEKDPLADVREGARRLAAEERYDEALALLASTRARARTNSTRVTTRSAGPRGASPAARAKGRASTRSRSRTCSSRSTRRACTASSRLRPGTGSSSRRARASWRGTQGRWPSCSRGYRQVGAPCDPIVGRERIEIEIDPEDSALATTRTRLRYASKDIRVETMRWRKMDGDWWIDPPAEVQERALGAASKGAGAPAQGTK